MWSVHACAYYGAVCLLLLLSCITRLEAQIRAQYRVMLSEPHVQTRAPFLTPLQDYPLQQRTIIAPLESVDEQAIGSGEPSNPGHEIKPRVDVDVCIGRRIFMYDLPPDFNSNIVARCNYGTTSWLNFCPHASNAGLGLLDTKKPGERTVRNQVDDAFRHGWYKTDPYMLELIFHSRLRYYPCRTSDPAIADAFFLPYYTGLDALRYLYNPTGQTDTHGEKLFAWLEENAAKEWARYGGKDHFMVLGRTSWDFGEVMSNGKETWGTGILGLPHMKNVTGLFIEKRPWMDNEEAVPYPTSFHPSPPELQQWLAKVRSAQRTHLFAFAGATRANLKESIRNRLLQQCKKSFVCRLVNCQKLKCSHNPRPIMRVFLHSKFCLQPRGDTPTRRSAFDAMIAGCIPVFFHHDSAYTQYTWHLPREAERYSVYISEGQIRSGISVEAQLSKYSDKHIQEMRENIISFIPRLLYGRQSDRPRLQSVDDAFDVSIQGVLQKIATLKEQMTRQS